MSIKQQRNFFRLVDKLGYDKVEAENKAKAKYGKKHFYDITSDEISPLIAILEAEEDKMDKKTPPAPIEDKFPMEYRVWDKKNSTMLEGEGAMTAMEFVTNENELNEFFHVMWYTGRKDERGIRLFDGDMIKTFSSKRLLIEWSTKDCAWIGYDMDTQESMFLGSIGKINKIGSIYEEVEE